MELFVLVMEPYHENSTVLGVYSSIEEAEKALGKPLEREGYFVAHWGAVAEWSGDADYVVYHHMLDTPAYAPMLSA